MTEKIRWLRCSIAAVSMAFGYPVAAQSPAHAPIMDVAWEQPYGGYHDPSLCANDCFEGSAEYTTPSYTSLGAERALTFVYRSTQAAPFGEVLINAQDTTAALAAKKMSIKLRRDDGSYVTATNGATELVYETDPNGGMNRLGFRFDASSVPSSTITLTAIITPYDASDQPGDTTEMPVEVMIINERNSSFGTGWSLLDFQRLTTLADGSVVITAGDGSAARFLLDTCDNGCFYDHPDGDFSLLTKRDSVIDGALWDRVYPDGTHVQYRPDGQELLAQDRFGNKTSFGYGDGVHLSDVIDPTDTLSFHLTYDANGMLQGVSDYEGRQSSFAIDPDSHDLIQIVDPTGAVAEGFTYDASHRMLAQTDRQGGVSTYAYDPAGRLQADTLPLVTVEGADARPLVQYRSIQSQSIPNLSVVPATLASPAPAQFADTIVGALINPLGRTIQLTINRFGSQTWLGEGAGRQATVEYDLYDRPTHIVSPSGHNMGFEYSATKPNVVSATDSSIGATVHYEYDETRYNLLTHAYGATRETTNYLSADGLRVDSTRIASDPVSKYTYDDRGRLVRATDPRGDSTTYTYTSGTQNPTGNLWQTRVGTDIATNHYDALGRLTAAIDPAGNTSTFNYDLLNRDTSAVSGGRTARTSYAAPGLAQVDTLTINGVGDVHSYNRLGWLDSITHGEGGTESFSYDSTGNLIAANNRRGQTIQYTYDFWDRLASRTAPNVRGSEVVNYTTDPLEHYQVITYADGKDSVVFDPAGRSVSDIVTRNGNTYTITRQFDIRGLRTSLALGGPGMADTILYVNDTTHEELSRVRGIGTGWSNIAFYSDGLLAGMNFANNVNTSVQWPGIHMQSEVTSTAANTGTLLDRGYNFTARGQRSQRLVGDDWAAQTEFNLENFTYDSLGQVTKTQMYSLAQSCAPGGGVQIVQDSQTGTGNCPWSGGTERFTYMWAYDSRGNPLPGTLQAGTDRLTSYNGLTMQYDADGNMTSKTANGFSLLLWWNAASELDSAVMTTSAGTTHVGYGYDGLGRRVRYTVNGATTYFVDDGENLLAEVSPTAAVQAEYTYWPGVDQPLSVRYGGASASVYFYHLDPSGNVEGMTDTTGTPVAMYEYFPFGEEFRTDWTNTLPNRLEFAARELDATGLYYFRARYYDPDLRRFISQDPTGSRTGANPYAYAANDPLDFADPSGFNPCSKAYQALGYETHLDPLARGGAWCVPSGALSLPAVVTYADANDPNSGSDWGAKSYPDSPAGPTQSARGGGGAGVGSTLQAGNTAMLIKCTFTATTGRALAMTAVDFIGVFPLAGNIFHGIQFGAAFVAAGTSIFGDVTAAGLSAAGAGLALADETGVTIEVKGAEVIPILGNFVAAGATVLDIIGEGGVIESYKGCVAGRA